MKTFTGIDFDEVVNQENTSESISNWCTIDAKTGVLVVHLEEGKGWDSEVYYDELGRSVPASSEDQRVTLPRWIMTYLFIEYLQNLFPNSSSFHEDVGIESRIFRVKTPISSLFHTMAPDENIELDRNQSNMSLASQASTEPPKSGMRSFFKPSTPSRGVSEKAPSPLIIRKDDVRTITD